MRAAREGVAPAAAAGRADALASRAGGALIAHDVATHAAVVAAADETEGFPAYLPCHGHGMPPRGGIERQSPECGLPACAVGETQAQRQRPVPPPPPPPPPRLKRREEHAKKGARHIKRSSIQRACVRYLASSRQLIRHPHALPIKSPRPVPEYVPPQGVSLLARAQAPLQRSWVKVSTPHSLVFILRFTLILTCSFATFHTTFHAAS